MLKSLQSYQKALPVFLAVALLALIGLSLAQPAPVKGAGDPVIAGAGDIACDPAASTFNNGDGSSTSCRQKWVSDLLVNMNPTAVFALGDNQYFDGTINKFMASYDPSWGRLKAITYPAAGNHEYLDPGAAGYFAYFGAAARPAGLSYYSYNLGAWHIVVLDSDCSYIGGCGFGSPEEQWLKADLAANANKCTLSYFHHPRFSSGQWGNNTYTDPFYQDLYAAHADVLLAGHDHHYERFDLQNPSGQADPQGIRQFVVGTGGANHTPWTTVQPNSQVRNNDTFGVLKLTLHGASYDWQFVPEAGKTFTDSGSTPCHNASSATPPPPTSSTAIATVSPAPSAVSTFVPVADSYVDSANPTVNHGTETQIRIDGSPIVRSYLRFAVQGLTAPVTKATLRLYANSSLSTGYSAYSVADNTWTESTINYGNAPAPGGVLGTTAAVVSTTWTSIDVTSFIQGNGTWSLGLGSTNVTALSLASRESSNKPQLVIETAASSSPTATSTATPSAPTNTHTPTPIPTQTATAIPSNTPTVLPTRTATPLPTDTATLTPSPAATATWTPTPASTSFSFKPVADAYVDASYPATNYGTLTQFRVDGSPVVKSYLRFSVQGLTGTVKQATLKIYANSSQSTGYSVRRVADNSWGENSLTNNNAPIVGTWIGSSGAVSGGTWISVDVTSYITGNGIYGFALITSSSTALSLASRESTKPPILLVQTVP